jgi:hypothetical protein
MKIILKIKFIPPQFLPSSGSTQSGWFVARLIFLNSLIRVTFCQHGYLWSLNQQYSIVDPSTGGSLADKSAVAILEHQLALTGHWERAGHAVLSALASWLLLQLLNPPPE